MEALLVASDNRRVGALWDTGGVRMNWCSENDKKLIASINARSDAREWCQTNLPHLITILASVWPPLGRNLQICLKDAGISTSSHVNFFRETNLPHSL